MIDIVEIRDTKIDQLAAVVLEYKVFVDAKLWFHCLKKV
ncbi:hypothetical protein OTSTA763_1923 [Orientia tsutsugamushi str. TA763]|nr:hypothetical protein OTSTA763_1923 [Orientia tsutsugamushi str. TA763]